MDALHHGAAQHTWPLGITRSPGVHILMEHTPALCLKRVHSSLVGWDPWGARSSGLPSAALPTNHPLHSVHKLLCQPAPSIPCLDLFQPAHLAIQLHSLSPCMPGHFYFLTVMCVNKLIPPKPYNILSSALWYIKR